MLRSKFSGLLERGLALVWFFAYGAMVTGLVLVGVFLH